MKEYTVCVKLWFDYDATEDFNDLEQAKAFAEKEIKVLGVQEVFILDEEDNIVAEY